MARRSTQTSRRSSSDKPKLATGAEADALRPAPKKRGSSAASKRAEPLLLEIAWETCNKVGGIYQVIRSKAPTMVENWGNRYCLVGPYNHASAQVEFEEAPAAGAIGQAVKQMRDMGFGVHYGRWLVTGRPHVVLLEYVNVFQSLHEVKYRLFTDHGIASPAGDQMINDCVAFGEVLRQFLWVLANREVSRRKVVAHFHEWMASVAVPMLRKDNWPGAIVFTTHATMLGRYLAQNDEHFYDHLPFYDADREAAKFNVETQYRIERAAAHGSHVFTTVSDVTAKECEGLLGRKCDILLPNGLNIQRFERLHELQNLHAKFKDQIHHFVMGHFFPTYSFDLDRTLYFFTSGRFEYKNKGMDLTVEALARLNHRLREAGSNITVICFLITRRPVRSINVRALESAAMLREFRQIADEIKDQLGDRLFEISATGRIPDFNTLVDDFRLLRLRRTIHAWRRDMPPAIVTHDLVDDATDPLLNQMRSCRLWNHQSDPVKVIYHPDFVSSTSPLLGMEYDEFVRGCHLGIFPSYYEPWGYTPLESIASGVPAITSDLSGFGSYLKQLLPEHEQEGMMVLHRHNRSYWEAADELAHKMFQFTQRSRRERIALRNGVENFSVHFDWHNLASRYHEAHRFALDRIS